MPSPRRLRLEEPLANGYAWLWVGLVAVGVVIGGVLCVRVWICLLLISSLGPCLVFLAANFMLPAFRIVFVTLAPPSFRQSGCKVSHHVDFGLAVPQNLYHFRSKWGSLE